MSQEGILFGTFLKINKIMSQDSRIGVPKRIVCNRLFLALKIRLQVLAPCDEYVPVPVIGNTITQAQYR